jgi:hypothetical protein
MCLRVYADAVVLLPTASPIENTETHYEIYSVLWPVRTVPMAIKIMCKYCDGGTR